MIYILLIVAVMVLDRIVKIAVNSNMAPGDTIPVIENIFHITYVQNTGAAFSMLQNHPTLLIVLPAIVIGIGIVFICVMSKAYNKIFLFSLSLICGGGLGNLTDRVSQGFVTDMFDFRVFPVFNVADICVCVGCGLLMLYMIIDANRNAGREKVEAGRKQAAAASAKSAGKASAKAGHSGSGRKPVKRLGKGSNNGR